MSVIKSERKESRLEVLSTKYTEKDIAELERINGILLCKIEKQKATIDYLSMMTDVPIEEDDNESEI